MEVEVVVGKVPLPADEAPMFGTRRCICGDGPITPPAASTSDPTDFSSDAPRLCPAVDPSGDHTV